jgi:hypothetical protein
MNAQTIQVKQADDVLVSLEDALKGLPKFPKGLTDFLVAIAPWVAIIVGVITLISMVFGTLIGLLASFFALLSGSPLWAIASLVHVVIGIAQGVLLVVAFKPLQKRELAGWRMLAYSSLLGVVAIVVNVVASLGVFSVIAGVISLAFAGLGFYILFQMKHAYK